MQIDRLLRQRNYAAWQVRADDFPVSGTEEERLCFLLRYALLAPSSHNSQPWRLSVAPPFITFKIASERALPVVDPLNRLSTIAVAAAAENCQLAADYFGYAATEEQVSSHEWRLACTSRGPIISNPDHLFHSITKRHCERGPYRIQRLAEDLKKEMAALVTSGVKITFVEDASERLCVTRIVLDARDELMDERSFRDELAAYKRHNLTRDGVGMPGFTMGFSTALSFITPFVIRRRNVARMTRQKDEDLMNVATPAFVVLSTSENTPAAWWEVGKVLERALLAATRRGYAANIMASPIDRDEWAVKLGEVIGLTSNERPQMFFRLGQPVAATHYPSPRLALPDVCENARV